MSNPISVLAIIVQVFSILNDILCLKERKRKSFSALHWIMVEIEKVGRVLKEDSCGLFNSE